jgi:hypothetical protein
VDHPFESGALVGRSYFSDNRAARSTLVFSRFFCRNEASFAIDFLSVRTIRPRNVSILIAESFTPAQLNAGLKTTLIAKDLKWVIQEKQIASYFQRSLLVDLSGQTGEIQIDFEFKARLFDNRRTELPVWVRTNAQTLLPI